MDVQPLRDLAAAAANGQKTAHGILVLKRVVVCLVIAAIQCKVVAITGVLENVTRPAAKAGATGHGGLPCIEGEFKPFDNNISRRAGDIETRRSLYFRAANGLRLDGDGLCGGSLFVDVDIGTGGIYAIGQDDHITRVGVIDGSLQRR